MSNRPAMHVFNAICNGIWYMPQTNIETLLTIAMRQNGDMFEKWLQEQAHADATQVAAVSGTRLEDNRRIEMRDGVAILQVRGPIFRYGDFFTRMSGATTVDQLSADFNEALRHPNVRAVLLNINSPGGEADGIGEFAQMIADARAQKPIQAYANLMATSAAYWIAAATSKITVDASALIGNIGTVLAVPDPKDPQNLKRVTFVSSQSPRKRPDPNSELGKDEYQQTVDHMTDVFVAAIARHRGVSTEKVLSDFGQGGILVGQHALDAGLVDTLGSYEQVVQSLGWTANRHHQGGTAAMPPEGTTAQESQGQQTAAAQSAAPAASSRDDENARLRQQIAALQAKQIETEANAWIERSLASGHATPAEQDTMLRLYMQAGADDYAQPVAEGQQPRTALLKAAYGARPAHGLLNERVPSGAGNQTLANRQQTGTSDKEELEAVDQSARAYAGRVNGKRPA